ncbi:hypothetical protein SMACR_09588 [Sordaria macrospora]|uniref:WGS project CABT00000000 data, contig 2.104 n=2 Tax=Sordaria macrospora TaxID=5147 RepID=F7WC95_SORMK|nr:uncharacterized protein SMAC_09588 [Sordaria macrospora k-hell]KAA8628706.1 hypothetical protein SMACR_09588 [Sordaria macrospora]WPJ61652.1 hypothetical protein SMAC4_09588 [Sordaria macrospora]CCC14567.1 unnamed protein product [Sordaria macrospora k-hell]
MSQQTPTNPIYPLFIFLFETERFLLETLKNHDLDLAQHSKLKTTNQAFRKWAKENITHLTKTARNLENSEVHKPKYYKAYQMLFWRLRGV